MAEMRRCIFENCGHVTERDDFLDHLIEVHGYRLVQTLSDLIEEDEGKEVELIASGYEWTCPNCDTLNKEMEIPNDETVRCSYCKNRYKISNYAHAQE